MSNKPQFPAITTFRVVAPMRELDPEKTPTVVIPTEEQVAEAIQEALRNPGKLVVVG